MAAAMNDDKKRRMIEKVLKLLEVGKDDNGAYDGEREQAQALAAKLMAEYAIDFKELQSAPKKGDMIRLDVSPVNDDYSLWESMLANCIAETFDCQMVQTRGKFSWTIVLMGIKSDVEITEFFYKQLIRTIGRKSELSFKSKQDQDTYAYGMVTTINSRMKDLYKKRQEVMDSDCRALVVVKTDAVKEFVSDQFPKLGKARSRKLTGSKEALERGRRDGHDVNLSRPIGYQNTIKPRIARGH